MILTNYTLLRRAVLFCLASLVIIFSSCDSPSSSVEKPQPETNAIQESADFFAHSPDSVNSMLMAAMDTLRKDDRIYPFVSKFIAQRGLPVWNKASGSYRDGQPAFKVPVRTAQDQKITGFVTIVINKGQPAYEWTPRGAKVDGKVSSGLEVMMWVYEKRVFGKTHTDDGRRIETKPSSSAKTGNVISTMDEPCGRVFCPEYGCSDWEGDCGDGGGGGDTDGDGWDDGGDLGPPDYGDGDSDGEGRSGGVDGGNGDNSDNNNDLECENNAVNVPFPGLMDLDEEDNPYPGPSNPPPCEEEEGDDGDDNSFMGEIDATDLANHPKADCVYGKLSQTGTMKKVISKFAGEDTQFDLDISVGDAGDAYGALDSSLGDNTFSMIISDSELGRTPLEISGTFLHEAIHAEMRRYLYGATDTSTLSGFPGDFSSDWDNYVFKKYGNLQDPVTAAEHEAMAKKYTGIIVDGLQEFDNDQLKPSSYEALAYVSLIDTETWENLDQEKKDDIGANYQDLKDDVLDTRSKNVSRIV